jgi:hypothetical protein
MIPRDEIELLERCESVMPDAAPAATVFAVWDRFAGCDPEVAETFIAVDACEAAERYAKLTTEDSDGSEDVLRLHVQNLDTRAIVTVEVEIEYEPKFTAKVTP